MAEETFGPYRIGPLLGRGGMGEVHRAHDTAHDRDVALKRLSPNLHDDAAFRARFRREAQIVARLREPHVIPIHAYGEIDGRLYLDMRLVEGVDLTDVIARGPLEAERAVRIVEQMASALDAAHADGLVHRDVKPSNVLVTPSDFVYLVDFGIARSTSPATTNITASNQVLGTLDYMAPERFENAPVDARVDIYALACVLYACLTGRRPFEVVGTAAQIWAHLREPPPKARAFNPAVPSALDNVITRGMAKNPADRHESAGALAAAARAALATAPPHALPGLAVPPSTIPAPPTAPPPNPLALTTPVPALTEPVTPIGGTPTPPARVPASSDETTLLAPGAQPPVATRVEPSSDNNLRTLGLVTAAVVTVLVVAYYFVFNGGFGTRTNNAGPTTTTTTAYTPTTSEPTTTTTSALKPEEVTLLAALPEVYRTGSSCVTEPADGEGVTAKVVCTENTAWSPRFTPPERAEFRLFADRAAQDAHFQALVVGRDIQRNDPQGGCEPKVHPAHYAQYSRHTSGPLNGDLITCYLDGGVGVLWWTDSQTVTTGTLFTKPGADNDTLALLDQWWGSRILLRM